MNADKRHQIFARLRDANPSLAAAISEARGTYDPLALIHSRAGARPVHACVLACARASVGASVRACGRACMRASGYGEHI